MNYISLIAEPKTLWLSFWLTFGLTLSFGLVMYVGEFGIIDEMYVADEIKTHLDEMSSYQKTLHVWLTGTIDVIYPFAYGTFFIGVALKAFGRFGIWLAVPSLFAIPADLTEGFAQIMLLTEHEEFMNLKTLSTKAKLALYFTGLTTTALGLILIAKKRYSSRITKTHGR